MINNKTIEVIENSDVFKKNVSILASTLKTVRFDAGQELLTELLLNRLDNNIEAMTAEVSKSIVFSRKDLQRNYYKEQAKVSEYEIEYEIEYDNELLENIPELVSGSTYLKDYNVDDNDTFNLIISLFRKDQQNLVARLILRGAKDTQEFYGDSDSVFNQKVKRVTQYAVTHQAKFKQALKTPYDLELEQMSRNIDEFFNIYESEFTTNKQVKDFFVKHQDEYTFARALDAVHYEGLLFDDFKGYKERSSFLIELNYQQQLLLYLIARRNAEKGRQTP